MASWKYEYQSELVRRNVEKGREQGLIEGALQAKAQAVLTILEARGIPVSEELRQRITASTDAAELDRWIGRTAVVRSAEEIFEGA